MTEELELTPDEILLITRGKPGKLADNICWHHFVSTGNRREGWFFFPRTGPEYEYRCEYCGKIRWGR